jgi:methylenetetrahydrofolate--tRNA-(uracil-5-)-methyltransferase
MPTVHVIGGGLAGSEAAWQLAERGHDVVVHEMRPLVGTPAHRTDRLAELVCSNTFKSTETSNAHGLLKAEMRLLGSLVLECADLARVPGGSALTVDRTIFSEAVHARVTSHPRIRIERGEATELPSPGVVATGPLTSSALADTIRTRLGLEALAFYDAIAPIVAHDSIDYDVVFRASRYGKETMNPVPVVPGERSATPIIPSERSATPVIPSERSATPVIPSERSATPVIPSERSESRNRARPDRASERAAGEGAYLNCPMSREQYEAFIDALTAADQASAHDFDAIPYFEGCMPAEEMARRGRETLRFGPMKPVGLRDPRTGREAYAVVQLRMEDRAGRMWNLVGFQTRLRYPEQQRVFRTIPGLENAEFLRYGSIHRNSYLNAPAALLPHLALRDDPRVLFAGQLTGVEGYTESTATGLLAGANLARLLAGEEPVLPPTSTMLGALYRYLREADPRHFQPMNANFGLVDELGERVRDKRAKKERLAERALAAMTEWRDAHLLAATARS